MAMCNGDPTFERCYKGHQGAVNSVHFNSNMKQLASGGNDNFVMVWNFQEQMRAFRFLGHKKPVTWVRFSPKGNLIASASIDETVRLWIPTIKGDSVVLKCHHAPVRCVEFSNDGKNLITTSDDKTVKLWDAKERKFISSFAGHRNWVRCASFDSSDKYIVSGSDDRAVKLWAKDDGKCLQTFDNSGGGVTSVSFQPGDSNCIAAAFTDGALRLWDIRTCQLLQFYQPVKTVSMNAVAFHSSGKYILTASEDSNLRILDLLEGRVIYTLQGHTKSTNCVAFSKNSEFFASGSADEQIFVWKTKFVPHDFSKIVKNIDLAKVQREQASVPPVDDVKHVTNGFGSLPSATMGNSSSLSASAGIEDGMALFSSENLELENHVETMECATHQLNSSVDVLKQTVSLLEQKLSIMQARFDSFMPLLEQLQDQMPSHAPTSIP